MMALVYICVMLISVVSCSYSKSGYGMYSSGSSGKHPNEDQQQQKDKRANERGELKIRDIKREIRYLIHASRNIHFNYQGGYEDYTMNFNNTSSDARRIFTARAPVDEPARGSYMRNLEEHIQRLQQNEREISQLERELEKLEDRLNRLN